MNRHFAEPAGMSKGAKRRPAAALHIFKHVPPEICGVGLPFAHLPIICAVYLYPICTGRRITPIKAGRKRTSPLSNDGADSKGLGQHPHLIFP